jgi:hypothetical protein
MEFANDVIYASLNSSYKQAIAAQNKRRAESISALQDELREQIIGKEKKNK